MNFDYGNVLTRALQITWKHKSFWLFMMLPMLIASGMFVAFAAPVFFLSENDETMGLVLAGWLAVGILGSIVNFIVSTAGMTSLTLGVLRTERGDGSTSFIDLVRDGFQYFGRALGAVLIIQLSIGAVFTVFFLCVALLSAVTMGLASICLQPIMILLTPLSFLMVAVMDGALMAVVDEGLGAWDAVKHAMQIVREHVWKFVFISLIVYLASTILSSVFIFPAIIPAMMGPVLMESGMDLNGMNFALIFVPFICLFFGGMSVLTGVTGTFMTSALGLSYLRLSHPIGGEVVFAPEPAKDATS
jgi:hypothetical protein